MQSAAYALSTGGKKGNPKSDQSYKYQVLYSSSKGAESPLDQRCQSRIREENVHTFTKQAIFKMCSYPATESTPLGARKARSDK